MTARIILLTNTGMEGRALAVRMAERGCAPKLIVQEEAQEKYNYSWPSRVARKVFGDRSVDRIAHLRQPAEVRSLLAWERAAHDASNEWLREATRGLWTRADWPKGVPTMRAQSVNDPEIVDHLRSLKPDLFVVYGTGLLRAPLLQIPRSGTLNAHSSLLPHYRGVRSEFWQCANDDPRYVGITVHLVDAHVDTGGILFQVATRSTWPSDPYRLRAANVLATLDNYPQVVMDHLAGRIKPVAQEHTDAPAYRRRDVTLEARLVLKKRIAG